MLFPIISPAIFILVVIILGSITPGYSQINYTMSRLAIEKYGIFQSLNFLQLAVGIYLIGTSLSSDIKQSGSKIAVRTIFLLCAMFLTIAAIAPTDPIENIPLRLTLYTPLGLIHAGAVVVFLAVSPVGIHRLAAILAKEPKYKRYETVTKITGYAVFSASIVWFVFFVLGIGLEYRGIFQKMIALPVLSWMTIIGIAARKSH